MSASNQPLAGVKVVELGQNVAGPYAGAIVGLLVATPACVAGEFIALPFAVGCGFAGGGLREATPPYARR